MAEIVIDVNKDNIDESIGNIEKYFQNLESQRKEKDKQDAIGKIHQTHTGMTEIDDISFLDKKTKEPWSSNREHPHTKRVVDVLEKNGFKPTQLKDGREGWYNPERNMFYWGSYWYNNRPSLTKDEGSDMYHTYGGQDIMRTKNLARDGKLYVEQKTNDARVSFNNKKREMMQKTADFLSGIFNKKQD